MKEMQVGFSSLCFVYSHVILIGRSIDQKVIVNEEIQQDPVGRFINWYYMAYWQNSSINKLFSAT
ncbi:hypothetical protein [Methyloglobulus sp.]|uniref:hypothetical protein n=1 Tax=Methyloglobulus sp. TaxID=2518622 RepID=UPI0032B7C14F